MKLILLAVCFGNIIVAIQSLDLLYEWRYVDYVWHSKEQKLNAIRTGEYNFTSIQMIDVDMAKDGRVFVTNIRSEGAPASLSTVSKFRGEGGPLLKPYPDWSWYKRGDCNGITSVYRVRIDECNKLYVLDTGVIDTVRICPAQLLVFDLHNDKLVKRITIPDNVARNASGQGLLITPIVVTSGPYCDLESVYIADTVGRGLVIMNSKRTFRLEADVFQPEDYYSNISVADKSFFLDDSLFGMALATPNPDYGETSHELYLRPLASRSLFAANCAVLDRSTNGNAIRYKIEPGMLPSQGTAMDFSADGTLFFGLTREIAIGCWNRHREMKPENIDIVLQDYHRLQFPSGLKIIPRDRSQSGSEEILIMSNTFQDLATDSRNFNLVNFRVMRSTVDPLTRGTKCTPPPRESSSFDHKPFHHHGRQPQRRPQSHY